jgi:hypothetical protein
MDNSPSLIWLSIWSSLVTSPRPTPVTSGEKARSHQEIRNSTGTKTVKSSIKPIPEAFQWSEFSSKSGDELEWSGAT